MSNAAPKNIFIIGAQCTGKTTLVEALADFYASRQVEPPPKIVSEVARNVMRRVDIHRHDIANTPERCLVLQEAIIQAQYDAESDLEVRRSWYISDRSGLDPVVYARLLVGEEGKQRLLELPTYSILEERMKQGLVFVCEAGCSWLVDDGTRLMPKDQEEWRRIDQAFRQLLQERGIEYVLVPSSVVGMRDRVDIVVKHF
ncbi:uncharacterized protein LTR77_004837 [Saxophila tyrrhenica]|uniref:NadR/Ttd14 AAA domain-containing protein n=1 Tax=Saxophila tyrrhenica TaxID=1690608 RepID=A0AAV9PB59_9PEZI|nr:hypothetical protein LTR77_004837 [Saxophila tyrrhenica]